MKAVKHLSLILYFCSCCLYPVQKGSDSAVSIEPFFTFPAADSDNAMLGFGWFKNGFALEDATTSCTFNSAYPVSGVVDLAGGTLYLAQDLVLQNITQLLGFGTIIGNGHSIEIGSSIDEMPSNIKVLKDVNLFFHHNIDFVSSVTIQGAVFISGSGSMLDMEASAAFVIDSNSSLKFQWMLLENIHDDNIRCVDDTGHLILDNIIWCQMGEMRYRYGDILFQNVVDMYGKYTFWYDSSMTCTIGDETTVKIGGGLNFKIGRKAPGAPEPLYMYDENSVLSFGDGILTVTGYGLNMKRGILENNVSMIFDAPSTSSSEGFIIGDGINPEEDVKILLGPGSLATFRSGWTVYNNSNGNGMYASAPSARMTRKIGSGMHFAKTCTFPQCVLEVETTSSALPKTTIAPGASLYCNNTQLSLPGVGAATITARREGIYSCVFDDNGSMYFSGGVYPGNIKVNGVNNTLLGNGAFVGNIMFLDSHSTLTCSLDGSILGNISLNGGTFILGNNMYFKKDASFITTGTINLDRYLVDFGFTDFAFNVPLNWVSDHGFININSNVSLMSTWTINGICTINGYGNTIALDEGGKIIVGPNSQLTIRGVSIDVIDIGDIVCADNTGIIVLDDVYWIQHSDYTFHTGSLLFHNKVVMNGDDLVFTYASSVPSIILSDSSLVLDHLFTFSYAPAIPSKTLLQLEDETSIFKFKGATLYMTATGMQLTKGTFEITQDSTIWGQAELDGDGNLINEGLTLGDSVAENDVYVNFMGDKKLSVHGALNYKNVRQDYLDMCTNSVINVGADSTLRVYENMDVGNGSVVFNQGATYARADGKQVLGAVNAAGEFNITTL